MLPFMDYGQHFDEMIGFDLVSSSLTRLAYSGESWAM